MEKKELVELIHKTYEDGFVCERNPSRYRNIPHQRARVLQTDHYVCVLGENHCFCDAPRNLGPIEAIVTLPLCNQRTVVIPNFEETGSKPVNTGDYPDVDRLCNTSGLSIAKDLVLLSEDIGSCSIYVHLLKSVMMRNGAKGVLIGGDLPRIGENEQAYKILRRPF